MPLSVRQAAELAELGAVRDGERHRRLVEVERLNALHVNAI
jgi:hypothetical protein